MHNFIPAASARILMNNSRSFEFLVIAANDAIMNAVKKTQSETLIPYDGVDDETHKRFHQFLISHGYLGGGKTHIGNNYFYKIKW